MLGFLFFKKKFKKFYIKNFLLIVLFFVLKVRLDFGDFRYRKGSKEVVFVGILGCCVLL